MTLMIVGLVAMMVSTITFSCNDQSLTVLSRTRRYTHTDYWQYQYRYVKAHHKRAYGMGTFEPMERG